MCSCYCSYLPMWFKNYKKYNANKAITIKKPDTRRLSSISLLEKLFLNCFITWVFNVR